MNKLEEFNASISSLQQEVENLHAIEQAYQQLSKLVKDYDTVLANLNAATQDMSTTKGELAKQSTNVSEKLIEQKKVLENATAEQRKELEEKLKNLQSLVEEKQEELQKLLNSNAEDISEANKKFYNDFVETIKTRLDNNRLEIKQLIDQDSSATKQQIRELKQEFQDVQSALSQQLLTQKKISLAFGIIVAVLIIADILLHFIG